MQNFFRFRICGAYYFSKVFFLYLKSTANNRTTLIFLIVFIKVLFSPYGGGMSEFLTFTIIHPRLTLGKINLFNVVVNIALNKPAHMQYLLNLNDNTHNAKNVVDGRISYRTWDGGQCAISAGRETATWWVNLSGIRSIHHINIFYMIGKRPWGISTFFTLTHE